MSSGIFASASWGFGALVALRRSLKAFGPIATISVFSTLNLAPHRKIQTISCHRIRKEYVKNTKMPPFISCRGYKINYEI
jgi:hypothetical protein